MKTILIFCLAGIFWLIILSLWFSCCAHWLVQTFRRRRSQPRYSKLNRDLFK